MKVKGFHIPLLTHTVFLFGIAQVLGVVVAQRIAALNDVATTQGGTLGLGVFLTYFGVGTLLILLLMKLYHGQIMYRVLFFLALCAGLVTVFQMVFPLPISLFVSLSFCIGLYLLPIIWVHNIAVIIASAGLGSLLGLQITWVVAVWLLIILSIYDVIAVYITGHMIHMAHVFITRQASFALIIPESWYALYEKIGDVRPSGGFLVLGGGDVVLPMLLSISLGTVSMTASYGAMIGSLVGVAANHIVIMRSQRPIPALPMIAISEIIGMGIGFWMGI